MIARDGAYAPDADAPSRARSIRRWLLLSGWLEIGLGVGHNILATLIITRPALVAPIVARMGWPTAILTPITPPEQNALVLATSLGSGTAWMLFGAILVWQGLARAARPDVPLLTILLVHQSIFLLLMALFVRFHVPAIATVVLMTTATGAALAKAPRRRAG